MTRADRDAALLGLAALVVGLVLLLSGCGSALSAAKGVTLVYGQATLVSARVLEEQRPAVIERLSAQARAEHPDDADARVARFQVLASPLLTLSSAQDALESSWLALAAAVAAWDASAGDEPSWQRALACAGASLLRVVRGLEALGVDVPPVLSTLAAQAVNFAESLCGPVPPTGSATGAGGP